MSDGSDDSNNVVNKALGPAALQFGQEVAPLGKELGALTVRVGHLLITGVGAAVYGIDRIADWLRAAVTERLENVDEQYITEPNPRIAVPAVQALIYSMNDDCIREMYANLLAADMDLSRKSNAHPAFVEMIKEMTPADAKVAELLSYGPQIEFRIRCRTGQSGQWREFGVEYSFNIDAIGNDQLSKSLSNLNRLGLIEFRQNEWPIIGQLNEKESSSIKKYDTQKKILLALPPETLKTMGMTVPKAIRTYAEKRGIYVTPLGKAFLSVCIMKSK